MSARHKRPESIITGATLWETTVMPSGWCRPGQFTDEDQADFALKQVDAKGGCWGILLRYESHSIL